MSENKKLNPPGRRMGRKQKSAAAGAVLGSTSAADRFKEKDSAETAADINAEEGMAKGGQMKVAKVMREFKKGKLRSGKEGPVVKNPKQAIAIALLEAGISKKKMMMGGYVRGGGAEIKGTKPCKIT